jgi:hypothetical protein
VTILKNKSEELEPTELTIREVLTGHVHTRERGKDLKTVAEYPHLNFSDIERYNQALAFAEKLGGEALSSFKDSFTTIETICARAKETGEVHPDYALLSFYFRLYKGDSLDFDGGIILHGLQYTYNVELTPKTGIYWSVHT